MVKRFNQHSRRVRRFGVEPLEPRQMLAAANLLITEFMATNVSTLLSGDGANEDWIEIYNADSTAVNLGNYSLTDNLNELSKWSFPAVSLSPGAFLVVFASAPVDINGDPIQNKIDSSGKYHASFKLDSGGEQLALTYIDPSTQVASIIHQYGSEYPDQFPDVSYGVASGGQLRYFDVTTPGSANGAGLLGVVEDTKFNVDRGFYESAFQLQITTQTPGASIYYTLDGTAPTPGGGILYTGPLTIDHTTVLRATAVKSGHLSSNVDTQTYFFVDDIVGQTQQSVIDAGYPGTWQAENGTFVADYGFDPDVVGTFDANGNPLGGDNYGGVYANRLKSDLLAIPSLSIVMDPDDMFENGPRSDRGIYIDPRKGRNDFTERATSVEWITPNGSVELQVDAGIQMQGGAFRSQFLTRKHSFRLDFKDEYGPSELDFPLLGPGATNQFNTLVLKATANDGYSWRSAQPVGGPSTLQYARDRFGHSLQLAMGHASPRESYAHLYINGIYWGLYSVQERPDADFAESYLGANPDTWDGLHSPDGDNDPPEIDSGNRDAWEAMLATSAQAAGSLQHYLELQGLSVDGSPSPTVAPLLDVANYIDYLIVNVWGGNDDWPHHNWWAGRDRNPETTDGFQFFLWDYDGVMGNARSWSPLDTKTFNQDFTSPAGNNVGEAHHYLQNNPEYRLAFADRVHKWFFNDGILTPDSLIARYQAIAEQVEQVMVAESARWGDMNSPTPTPLTLAEWTTERDWLLNTYLPQRSAIVLQEMRDYGFYPTTAAPSFNQHGGVVPDGFDLTIQASQGTIYYTLDGTDPRFIGGALSPTAIAYSGQAINIGDNVTVQARVLHAGQWSALNEADFALVKTGDVTKLRITELQYHPADYPGVTDDEDLEFIEILNTGTASVSLDGVQIAGFATIPYSFSAGLTLAGGERIVVARNVTAFTSFYGSGINVAPTGYADSNLSNGGETVTLLGPADEVLHSFAYSDDAPWPTAADGGGPSLEIIDPLGDASDPTNWRASLYYVGSPGVEGLPIAGDYDLSGTVDQADHSLWRAAYGANVVIVGSGADGNSDGVVNAADYTVWRDHQGDSTSLYGAGAAFGSTPLSELDAAAVVAPSAILEERTASSQSNVDAIRQAAFAQFATASPVASSRGGYAPPMRAAAVSSPQENLLLIEQAFELRGSTEARSFVLSEGAVENDSDWEGDTPPLQVRLMSFAGATRG
jgi:hypothetical protein